MAAAAIAVAWGGEDSCDQESGTESCPVEAVHAGLIYEAGRSSAPCRCGVLVIRGDCALFGRRISARDAAGEGEKRPSWPACKRYTAKRGSSCSGLSGRR